MSGKHYEEPDSIITNRIVVELFRHFTKTGHHGFLEDINVQIIDKVFRDFRQKEEHWQFN